MATHGYVDGVRDGQLHGWVHDADRPGERIELEVVLDGQLIGRCRADLPREDLVRAGIGDGRHGFRLALPRVLVRGLTHVLEVRALGDGARIGLAPDYFAEAPGDAELPGPRLTTDTRPAAAEDATSEAVPDPPARASIPGADGWRFAPPPARLRRALGDDSTGPAEVERELALLAARHESLARRQIDYVAVAVPDKGAVYPDRLPGGYELDAERRPAARLSARMRREPRLELLDLWPVLRDARAEGRVFHRSADLLTWTGAFHAYRAVAKELAKRGRLIEPLPADWLGLGDLVPVENGGELEAGLDRVRLGARAAAAAAAAGLSGLLSERATVLESPEGRGSAVIAHDGSAGRIALFLAEHFASTVIEPGGQLPAALIDRVSPGVVVELRGEGGPWV